MIIISSLMIPLVVLSLIGTVLVMGVTGTDSAQHDNQSDRSISNTDKLTPPG